MSNTVLKWLATKPPKVQAAVQAYPPGVYLLRTTMQVIEIVSYEEDKATQDCTRCRVLVIGGPNVGCEVFGIDLVDLIPVKQEPGKYHVWKKPELKAE